MSTVAESGQKFYDEEDAEEILRLAASMSAPMGSMNRERLLATAAELGISQEAVDMAEIQYAGEKEERLLQREFDNQERSNFRVHLIVYCIVNGGLVLMNLFTGAREFWAIFPILGWGIGLGSHAACVFNRGSQTYLDAYQRWLERRNGSETSDEIVILNGQRRSSPSISVGIHVGSHRRQANRDRRQAMRDDRQRDR